MPVAVHYHVALYRAKPMGRSYRKLHFVCIRLSIILHLRRKTNLRTGQRQII